MFIQVHKPDALSNNAGTSKDLISYLEKENEVKELVDEIPFFSHDSDSVSSIKAQLDLDCNHRGLKEKESKFFMLTINPSEKELLHLKNDPIALRSYTRSVMDEYAKNFSREIDGKQVSGSDLVYFAKIEHSRRYDPLDKKFANDYKHNQDIRKQINTLKRDLPFNQLPSKNVQKAIGDLERKFILDKDNGVILPGNNKPGLNTHVHVVVSRKDKQQRVSLSPFANSRNSKNTLNGKQVQIGFDRKQFVQNCEVKFDNQFDYHRPTNETFVYKHAQKHDTAKFINTALRMPTNEKELARRIVTELFDKDKQIQRMLSPLSRVPKTQKQMSAKIQNTAIDAVSKLIANGANPTATAIKLVVQKTIDLGLSSQGLSL